MIKPQTLARLGVLAAVAGSLALASGPGFSASGSPKPADPALLSRITTAANSAREQCYPRIHHDTIVFEHCLLALSGEDEHARQHRPPASTTPDRATRLGVLYFGWVGAMNSRRMGMIGAEGSALRFLARLAPLQKSLGVSDTALCQTLPGDCDARVAQLTAQRNELKAQGNKPPAMPEEDGHAH